MSLPYLKIEPEEALKRLDNCIVSGYMIKDQINGDYFPKKAAVSDHDLEKWDGMATTWAGDCLNQLAEIFVSLKESYNFRDAPSSPMVRVGTNMKWNNIINKLEARIDKLNEYDKSIHEHFKVNMEIIGRDKIIQTGESPTLKIKN